MFGGKASKAEANTIIPTPVITTKKDPGNTGRIGERPMKSAWEIKEYNTVHNKIDRWRKKNKMARQSRNDQHRKAA